MTKDEQTIANLKKLKSVHNGSYGADIDIAIKALKKQSCEDSVSRQALLDSIAEIDGNTNMDIYTDEVREIINALPSVTPQRPKGHWIREFDDIEGEVRFVCSNCRKHQLFASDFCYHCGSDNGKEEE